MDTVNHFMYMYIRVRVPQKYEVYGLKDELRHINFPQSKPLFQRNGELSRL